MSLYISGNNKTRILWNFVGDMIGMSWDNTGYNSDLTTNSRKSVDNSNPIATRPQQGYNGHICLMMKHHPTIL